MNGMQFSLVCIIYGQASKADGMAWHGMDDTI